MFCMDVKISHIKESAQMEGVREQGAEEDIWN
jgi:hypothetical protein